MVEVGVLLGDDDVPVEDQDTIAIIYQHLGEKLGGLAGMVGRVYRCRIIGYDTQEVSFSLKQTQVNGHE